MKSPDRTRVAVIGDSYVEAFQVPHYASLAEQLEALLGEDRTEVYRFGISGAPLSQYLYMFETEVAAYNPEWENKSVRFFVPCPLFPITLSCSPSPRRSRTG
jgi:hypothetical protein